MDEGLKSRLSRLVVIATLLAGTLDILSASVYAVIAGRTPIQMLTSVSGAIGAKALGTPAAPLIGLALHYAIMAVMASVYIFAARCMPILTFRPIASGVGYGLATWAVMNLVVLPLRWPSLFPTFDALALLEQLFSHIVLVGIPIALIARRVRQE